MKNLFLSIILITGVFWYALGAAKSTGTIIKRPDNVGKVLEFDEGIRAMAGWYDAYQGKATDTGLMVVSTKFGDSIWVRGFVNNRDSTITIKMLWDNTRTDTNFFRIPSCQSLWPLPIVWKFWVDETDNSLDSINVMRQLSR